MIKFTIVTCTFNAEHELQRTLDSVFHQSYADVEHLILDGLSSDRSVETFPSEATLEHIAHSIGDGEALPGVIYGDTDIVNDEGRFLRHRRLQPPTKLTWRSFRNGMLVCHQAFYALTTLAKDNPYNLNYRFSADVDWCIRVMKEAERRHLTLKNVDEVVVNYLDGGMTEKNHRASLRERFSVMRRHYGLPLTLIMHVWFVVRQLKK